MGERRVSDLEDLYSELSQDEGFREADRKVKPYFDLIEQIVARRIELGLTQKDLAKRAKTHQSRISRIETGEHDIRLSTLIDIAEALNSEVCVQLVPLQETVPYDVSTEYITLFIQPTSVRNAKAAASEENQFTWTEIG